MTTQTGTSDSIADWEEGARWRKAAGEHLLIARRALGEALARCSTAASTECVVISNALAAAIVASERCESNERACRERVEALR